MKKFLALILAMLLPSLHTAQSNPVGRPIVLTHVTVIGVTGTPSKPDQTVIIRGSRIVGLGKSGEFRVPQNAFVIDATGKFLIPGLWDMHTHTNWSKTKEVEERFFPLFIVNGVTGVREMGSIHSIEQFIRWRERSVAGKLLAPRIVVGKFMDGKGGSSLAYQVKNEAEARTAVQRIKREGYDFVKVYSGLSRESFLAVADEAKKLNIPFAGHVPFVMNAGEASDARIKSIEHLTEFNTSASTDEDKLRQEELSFGKRFAGLPKRDSQLEEAKLTAKFLDSYNEEKAKQLFARFMRNGTWICPTLIITRSYAKASDAGTYADPNFRYISAERRLKDAPYWNDLRGRPAEQFAVWNRGYQLRLRQIGAAHRAGVKFLAGTDTGSFGSSYPIAGFSLHDELALFVQAGLSPLEALQTATLNPAKFLGLEKSTGTIEEGKLADLVLLDANPLDDINNTKKIAAVVANGKYLPREKLQEILSNLESR
jgi:imidazolonepropionase-like amidohydrolase